MHKYESSAPATPPLPLQPPRTVTRLYTRVLADGVPEEDVQPVVTYEEILVGGVERKRQTGTWKEWTWPAADAAFTSQDDFRAYLLGHVYPTPLHRFLGKEREVGSELPAELALRARCAELWREVNESVRAFQEQLQEGTLKVVPGAGGKGGHKRTRASVEEVVAATKQHHIDMIIKMMASLCQEHDLLYTSIAHPLTLFLVGTIRDSVRNSQVRCPRRLPVIARRRHSQSRRARMGIQLVAPAPRSVGRSVPAGHVSRRSVWRRTLPW